ncbi:unnamed protein product [Ectocarpus sp. 8 AP-2014]
MQYAAAFGPRFYFAWTLGHDGPHITITANKRAKSKHLALCGSRMCRKAPTPPDHCFPPRWRLWPRNVPRVPLRPVVDPPHFSRAMLTQAPTTCARDASWPVQYTGGRQLTVRGDISRCRLLRTL